MHLRDGKYQLVTETGSLRDEDNKPYPTNLFWLPLGNQKERNKLYIRIHTYLETYCSSNSRWAPLDH